MAPEAIFSALRYLDVPSRRVLEACLSRT